ncbi:uncharacterized protein [Physcomitrium patens]|nr:uncharacterized protein LOC112277117 isoform X3 [Physcomitrium patens]|eukprot:XP_024364879.1 uncharacterized protein LOC112277117 isoform X3 [Physcomitrella patens]
MTFYKELIYHAFFPLSLPLIYWFEGGTNGIINRQYWGSPFAIAQWVLGITFYAMNVLSVLYTTPDIVIVNMLIIMRHMVIATKYGFNSKSDMAEMRQKVLPHQKLADLTLFIAWTNPIPLRVLKRQLLLAAARSNMLICTLSLRLVPGASRNTVQEIMHRLSHEGPDFWRRGRVISRKRKMQSKLHSIHCEYCLKNSFVDRELEDRWVQLCMTQLDADPRCRLPGSCEAFSEGNNEVEGHDNMTGGMDSDVVPSQTEKIMTDQVDLPALLLAAHLLQQSGDLLTKKKFGHQLFKNPMRVWYAAGCVAILHTSIPYIVRGITGVPSVWGGNAWYVHVVNLSSIVISFHAMTSSVSFMIAGIADFRRRYFAARLLNTLLKDGCFGKDTSPVVEAGIFAQEYKSQKPRRKSEYHTAVTVDFGHASSMIGWWCVRVLVLDFGLVFSRRVKYYASYFCVYCGVLMAFLLIALFSSGTRKTSYIMGVVTFDLIVFIGLLALIVFPGGETNSMHLGHGATLVFKKMELATKLKDGRLSYASVKEREEYSFALEVMVTISEALAWDNTITKVTILGFKAGSEVISVLLGFGGAAIGIVAQQMTSYLGRTSQ